MLLLRPCCCPRSIRPVLRPRTDLRGLLCLRRGTLRGLLFRHRRLLLRGAFLCLRGLRLQILHALSSASRRLGLRGRLSSLLRPCCGGLRVHLCWKASGPRHSAYRCSESQQKRSARRAWVWLLGLIHPRRLSFFAHLQDGVINAATASAGDAGADAGVGMSPSHREGGSGPSRSQELFAVSDAGRRLLGDDHPGTGATSSWARSRLSFRNRLFRGLLMGHLGHLWARSAVIIHRAYCIRYALWVRRPPSTFHDRNPRDWAGHCSICPERHHRSAGVVQIAPTRICSAGGVCHRRLLGVCLSFRHGLGA